MKLSERTRDAIRLGWPFFVLVVALVRGLQSYPFTRPDELDFAHLMTGSIYQAFVILSLGILLAPRSLGERHPERWKGWWALDDGLCTFLFSQGMKLVFHLPRPTGHSHSGFPSGHTMYAMSLAWLVSQKYFMVAPVWFLLAALVGWSRVATHEHYPYQVYFGAAFGLLLGAAVSHWRDGVLLPRLLGNARSQTDR